MNKVIDEQGVIEDYLAGTPVSVISGKYQIGTSTCNKILKRNNIKFRGNPKILKIDEQTLILDYLNGMTRKDITIKYKINRKRISPILRRNNTSFKSKKLSENDERAIIDLYLNKKSMKKVAREDEISIAIIKRILNKYNIPIYDYRISQNCYALNENAFETITEKSAYWIGFLMADGGIRDDDKSVIYTSRSLRLQLAEEDKNHVEKLKEFLQYSGNTSVVKSTIKVDKITNKEYICQPLCKLDISSARIVRSLAQYGVVARKSKIAKLSEKLINNSHLKHVIRGLIDGDGSIVEYENIKFPVLSLCGSEFIIRQFMFFVKSIIPEYKRNIYICKNKNLFEAKVSGFQALKVIEVLYSDAIIYLDRKYEKATRNIEEHNYLLKEAIK